MTSSAPELPSMPLRLPVVGHFLSYVRDPLRFFERASRVGPLVRVDLPGMTAVFVNDPEIAEAILVTHNRAFVKDRFLRDLRRVLGLGLLTNEGDPWRRQRRLAQPAFHRDRIAGYAATMVDRARAYADACGAARGRASADGEVRDVHADMMEMTLDIVGRTLFGAHVGTLATEIGECLDAVTARYSDAVVMAVPAWDKLPTPLNRRFDAAVRRLDAIVRGLLRSHRAGTTGDGRDLLSMLLAARDEDGTPMSDDQLRDEAMTLLLAGHETTALSLSFTWMLLAEHPRVRERLEAELREVLGDRDPTVDDVPRLALADRIVRESMRLYPPAWSIGREACEDVTLAGRRFPRGTWFWLLPWSMHRDARFFPDPERFDPDRWSGDFAKNLPRFAYFPFGGGPRQCIGNAFASMETLLCLATIAQRVRLDLPAGAVARVRRAELLPAVTLRPKHGLRMRVSRR